MCVRALDTTKAVLRLRREWDFHGDLVVVVMTRGDARWLAGLRCTGHSEFVPQNLELKTTRFLVKNLTRFTSGGGIRAGT